MTASPFSLGTRILGGAATVLLLFLTIGWLLPSEWEADASKRIAATPEEIFELVDSPEGWQAWTQWPDSGLIREGPERGAGAAIRWQNVELGSGRFEIVETVSPRKVVYSVEVAEGGMRTLGALELLADGGSVMVTWHEEGDLGRNPLMGYWARAMSGAQSTELQKSLERLSAVVSDSARIR